MAIYDERVEKVIESVVNIIDGVSKPFADRDKYDDYVKPPYETSDTPPDMQYTNLDDYDGNDEWEYRDGDYCKK